MINNNSHNNQSQAKAKAETIKVNYDYAEVMGLHQIKATVINGNIARATAIVGCQSSGISNIRRVDGDNYADLTTGEIKPYRKSKARGKSNAESIKKTMTKLRDLINANFSGADNEVMITLTYAQDGNQADIDNHNQMGRDFKRFMRRLHNLYPRKQFGHIWVVEAQGNGAYHMHLLLKQFNARRLWIPAATVSGLWGKGFIKVQRVYTLPGDNNVAKYLSSYLSGVGSSAHMQEKQRRITLINRDSKIYGCSRNMVRPTTKVTTFDAMAKDYGLPVNVAKYNVSLNGDVIRSIYYLSFDRYQADQALEELTSMAEEELRSAVNQIMADELKNA